MTTHLESAQDLAVLLGPREADIMRRLWSGGPATVREIHTHLTTDPPLAYTTIMTICVRLWEKGLLERRRVAATDQRPHAGKAKVIQGIYSVVGCTPQVTPENVMVSFVLDVVIITLMVGIGARHFPQLIVWVGYLALATIPWRVGYALAQQR